MISIQFEDVEDFNTVYIQLERHIMKMNELGLQVSMNYHEETIYIDYQDSAVSFYDSFHPLLASVLTNHVINTCEEKWLLDIIGEIFYYEDEEEMKQILEIALSILAGDRNDIPSLKPFFERSGFIYQAFANGIDENTEFYYDPFLTFRLKEYGEMLIDCVEVAIDEYLLEQEYQNIVDSLRGFIHTQTPRYQTVHLVQQENRFIFYNEKFEMIDKQEKELYIEQSLIFEGEMDLDEMVISPVVSMNPKQVIIYSDDEDNNVIYTIQTIFEERAKLLSLTSFRKHFIKNLN